MNEAAAQSESYSPIDRSLIEQYKKLRPGFLERLVTAYLSESAGYMAKIRTGMPSNDLETVRITAHALKSASVNLGAMKLGAVCQEVESAAQQSNVPALGTLISDLGVEYFEAEQALRGVLIEARAAPA